jgi:hypothetical protein
VAGSLEEEIQIRITRGHPILLEMAIMEEITCSCKTKYCLRIK